jgi:uncharacterized protein (TIGR01777 family)
METKKMILAGGSGFLGQALINSFKDYEIVILSRNPQTVTDRVRYVQWDGKTLGNWAKELENCEVIINLTGRTVDCRYNERNKKEILESRVNATVIIGEAIRQCSNPPGLWINSASATIFRNALDRPMDEETGEFGSGFSVDVCKKWEAVFNESKTPKTRKVLLRIAMVLGKNGGVMPVMTRLVRLGLGGKLGKGDQFVSWVHEYDFVNLIHWIIEHEQIEGTYNCTAPNPVRNNEFMKILREACKMPFGIPSAKWMLEIGAFFIRTETELVLKSRRVVPKKLLDSGFVFKYPEVSLAINDLVNS